MNEFHIKGISYVFNAMALLLFSISIIYFIIFCLIQGGWDPSSLSDISIRIRFMTLKKLCVKSSKWRLYSNEMRRYLNNKYDV